MPKAKKKRQTRKTPKKKTRRWLSTSRQTNRALIVEARERIRTNKRLAQAHYEAVQKSRTLKDAERRRLLNEHHALAVAAAKTGKRLTDWDREYLTANAPRLKLPEAISRQESKQRWRIRDRTIKRPRCKDAGRRHDLEQSGEHWLKYYLPHDFSLDWGTPQRQTIQAAERAMRQGASMAVAGPRGFGKTTMLGGVGLFGTLAGICTFPIVAGWTHTAAKTTLRGWLNELATNPRLAQDYPEICQPFRASIHAKRLRVLLWPEGNLTGADVRIVEGVIVLPGRRALASASIKGSIRGIRVKLDRGWLRPDVLFLDDPQDKPTAETAKLVRQVIERIDKDLMSLSGPRRRITLMAAVTVIENDDVADQLLKRRDIVAIRCGQITKWPAKWDDPTSPARKAWEAWNEERLIGLGEHDGGKRAARYYRKHKKILTKGMAVSWPERYDEERGDPDALFSAMWDYYRLGHAAFMAERQNEPVKPETTTYDLSTDVVLGAIYPGRKAYEIPPEANVTIATTDLNYYGLHSGALAFQNDQTAAVAWYGVHDRKGKGIVPKNCPEAEAKKRMFEALANVAGAIAELPLVRDGERAQVDLWLIDVRYMGDVVRRFIEGPGRRCGVRAVAYMGYSAEKYRPTPKNVIGKPREQSHMAQTAHSGRFIAANSDYWREVSQRAWFGTPGAPGSLSLFEGRHYAFAEQICRVKLVEKLIGQHGTRWNYNFAPGRHDWADNIHMAYVGAVWQGIGTQGRVRRRRPRYKERRKARVPIEE
jgi:hypothetical protein